LRSDSGQSSVEFALVLPLVLVVLLALLQGGVLLRDQLLVTSAAREGAREAAVSAQLARVEAAARRAAPNLALGVTLRRGRARGESAVVTVTARPVRLPLVGAIVAGRTLRSSATMRVERAG